MAWLSVWGAGRSKDSETRVLASKSQALGQGAKQPSLISPHPWPGHTIPLTSVKASHKPCLRAPVTGISPLLSQSKCFSACPSPDPPLAFRESPIHWLTVWGPISSTPHRTVVYLEPCPGSVSSPHIPPSSRSEGERLRSSARGPKPQARGNAGRNCALWALTQLARAWPGCGPRDIQQHLSPEAAHGCFMSQQL